MIEVEALCDFCKQPLGHEETVEIRRHVYHPSCAEVARARLASFWDWIMSVDFVGSDCSICFHLPVAPASWHCAKHEKAPADCGDWEGVNKVE